MARGLRNVLRELRQVLIGRDAAELSDAHLLERFVTDKEEAAFEALVRRHGPMVWGVCQRVLQNSHDAEDAFQATFLVLTRKAGSIARRDLLGGWLYGVAYRISLRGKAMTAKRQAKERLAGNHVRHETHDDSLWSDLEPLLDRELSRLPRKYQMAIVLCDLQGINRKDVAKRLGVPEGTLSSRLARGRELLRERLRRQGLAISTVTLAATLAQQAATASVPAAVVKSTIKAAALFGAGSAAAGGALSAPAAVLAQGFMKTLLLARLKIAMVLVLGLGLLGGITAVVSGPDAEPTLTTVAAPGRGPADLSLLARSGPDTNLALPRPQQTVAGRASAAVAELDPLDQLEIEAGMEADPPEPPAVLPPPASLKCDPFYKKYVNAGGLPILSSAKVSDHALREAAYLVNSILHERPDLREAMVQGQVRFVVMHPTEKTTDLPEQRDLEPKESWDRRRGLGDLLRNCGEENLLNLPGDRHARKNILVHEVAHTVHFKGLKRIDPDFDARLKQLYRSARARGLWRGTRAAYSAAEYWAEAVQAYFDCNQVQVKTNAGVTPVNTREQLRAYDAAMYELIDEVFRGTRWRYTPPVRRYEVVPQP